jgi:solute carrier family 45 protein 1/2/4
MTALGNVIGYSIGYADLGRQPWLRWIGGGQFRKLALIALLGMALGVGITCAGTPEKQIAESSASRQGGVLAELRRSVRDIWHAIVRLPRPVRRVCATQMFAFMGWFPMLFYASSYIAEIHAYDHLQAQAQPQIGDKDAERGSLALLLYALVALAAGMLLPYAALAAGSHRPKLLGPNDQLRASPHGEDGEQEAGTPRISLSRTQRLARGLREGMTLRSIWTASLVLLAALMAGTLLPLRTKAATALIAAVGISWAVASWVPFALVMEFAKEAEQGSSPFEFETDWHGPARVAQRRESMLAAERSAAREQLNAALGDCAPLRGGENEPAVNGGTFLARGTEVVEDGAAPGDGEGGLGGTILGIHNLAIVLPQFVVAIVGALIFRAADAAAGGEAGDVPRPEHGGTAWVLRYGGAMALVAALLTRYVPLTQTERERRGERVGPHFDDEVGSDEGAVE